MGISGMETMMVDNKWNSYFEASLEEDRDPVLDDPIIYGVNVKSFSLTVYHPDGRVKKYWNARILKDLVGCCRIVCPRDGKILCFTWFDWTAYMFSHDGMNELVLMPDSRRRAVSQLSMDNSGIKEVK